MVAALVHTTLSLQASPTCGPGSYLGNVPESVAEYAEHIVESPTVQLVRWHDPQHLPSVRMASSWEKIAITNKDRLTLVMYLTDGPLGKQLGRELNVTQERLPLWLLYDRRRPTSAERQARCNAADQEREEEGECVARPFGASGDCERNRRVDCESSSGQPLPPLPPVALCEGIDRPWGEMLSTINERLEGCEQEQPSARPANGLSGGEGPRKCLKKVQWD